MKLWNSYVVSSDCMTLIMYVLISAKLIFIESAPCCFFFFMMWTIALLPISECYNFDDY